VSGIDNPLVIADVARYYEGLGGRSTALYDFLGVRYVLGSKEVTLDWDKFSLASDQDPQVNVYRNERALPRAFVVHQAETVGSHDAAWQRIHESGFDPAETVVLEDGQPLAVQSDAPAEVNVVRYETNGLEIAVVSEAEGYLVLSDPFYPGWQAELDGEPAPILRANYAFRAVRIPAGNHRLTMAFRPASWSLGLLISGLTLVALVAAAVVSALRRKGKRRPGR